MRSKRDGVTQANGVVTAPSANVPDIWLVISTISFVSRSMRVTIISSAKARLPASAISAGQVKRGGRGPQRDQHAAEAGQHREPAPPADLLAEQQRGERGDVDRAGEIERDRVGERQIDDRPEEQRDFGGAERHAQQLQAGPRRADENRAARAPDERRQQDQRRGATDRQELADRIGRDQPFSDRVVDAEQEHAERHQPDAGQARPVRVAPAPSRRSAGCDAPRAPAPARARRCRDLPRR